MKEISKELLKLAFNVLRLIVLVVGLGILIWKGFF